MKPTDAAGQVAWIQLSASGHSYREFSVHWCEQGSLSHRRMSESRQRLNRSRLACVLGFADPACCTIPITGCSPCAADCTGRLTVGMTRDFADGEARATTPSHTCITCGVRHSVRRAGTPLGRARNVGSSAHAARGPRRNITGPLSFTGAPFDRPPCPPASKMRASRQSGSAKIRNAEPRQKQRHRHTVIDRRRATTLTASSTFGINQFYVNAIASLSYNRVCPQTSCCYSIEDRSVFEAQYLLTDRRIGDSRDSKKNILFKRDPMRGDDRIVGDISWLRLLADKFCSSSISSSMST